MRTNLVVPYVDKDKVKRLGARWDRDLRLWYVENVENLEDFLEWIPEYLKKPPAQRVFARREPVHGDVDDALRNALEGCAEALDAARLYADVSIIPKLNIATRLIDDALKLIDQKNV
jgi:hypothetical protein